MFRAILCSSSGGQNCIFTASGIVTLKIKWGILYIRFVWPSTFMLSRSCQYYGAKCSVRKKPTATAGSVSLCTVMSQYCTVRFGNTVSAPSIFTTVGVQPHKTEAKYSCRDPLPWPPAARHCYVITQLSTLNPSNHGKIAFVTSLTKKTYRYNVKSDAKITKPIIKSL
jgi:hypothetical protein